MRSAARTLAVLASLMLSSTMLPAGEETLTANFSQSVGANFYSVNFPAELGGQSFYLPINGGQFRMSIDTTTGALKLLSWRQDIEPITILGASTGPIVVRLDESQPSTGTYVPEESRFEVTATFILEFDDSQLRDFGFVSPFALTATERGNIVGAGRIGKVSMDLEGVGQFGLGQFTYTCKTTAAFVYDLPAGMGQPGDVNHDLALDVSDPIAGLAILFQGETDGCPGAIEVNGDGTRDISDVIYMFDFLFMGSTPPPLTPIDC